MPDLLRLAAAKIAARVAVFGIHIAAFGAAYHFGADSFGMSLAVAVLSVVCLLAEIVLAEHFSALVAGTSPPGIGIGLKLRHVFILWYSFATLFWAFIAYGNYPGNI